MAFNHQKYNTQYLLNARDGGEPINDAAEEYGVRIAEADVAEGQTYWRVIGVHHLFPRENFSKHNVFIEALDEEGRRVRNPFPWAGWTWVGRQPNERADPLPLDKPDYEPAGNIAMHFQQTITIWIKGLSRDANDISDRVENLHTRHPDEPLEDGSLLNTLGHHSFYIVFQRTRKSAPTVKDGVISGQVTNGQGLTVRLSKANQTVAEQTLGPDARFRFENLAYGTYKVTVLNTSLVQDNVRVDQSKKSVFLTLAVPAPTKSAIFGKIHNGAGLTLLLVKENNIIARMTIPETTEYRFVNLAAGVYSLEVFGESVRQDNIALNGTNSREVNLTVSETDVMEKTLGHYILLGPPGTTGRRVNLLIVLDFALHFSATIGFSATESQQARQVTIVGDGISQAQQNAIRQSGSQLEVLSGGAYAIEAQLQARIQSGNAFP